MLSLKINTNEQEQSINLVGDLKGIDALEFRQKITSVIDKDAKKVVLNLFQLESIDLTGFNAIVMFKKEVESQPKQFRIIVEDDNAFQEYLHLSKLNLNCIKNNNL